MTRLEALRQAGRILADQQIEDAPLEAELLLRHTLGIDRVQLLIHYDTALTTQQETNFWKNVERRLKGEPGAYITGHREFFNLDFEVDSSVLIPRPETELLVEKTIEYAGKYKSPKIVDVGTGCGAIAISLAVHLSDARIYATDISEEALKVAQRNAQKHNIFNRIEFMQGNLLEPLPESVDIIVANLPYVRTEDLSSVNTIGFEPITALDGGHDGLEIIKELCLQAQDKLLPDGSLLLEIGLGQADLVKGFLRRNGIVSDVEVSRDLSGIDRVVSITRLATTANLTSH